MPVTSFVADPVFDRALPPALAPGKRCRRPRAKPKRAPMPPQCRSVLIDRIEAATLDGRIELCDEEMPCESLDFTLEELAFLLRLLFPEEYRDPHAGRALPPATATAPGSAERIAEYAWRVAQRRAVTVAGDARADRAHDRGLKIEQRKNGSGVKVVGWADEDEECPRR